MYIYGIVVRRGTFKSAYSLQNAGEHGLPPFQTCLLVYVCIVRICMCDRKCVLPLTNMLNGAKIWAVAWENVKRFLTQRNHAVGYFLDVILLEEERLRARSAMTKVP